MWPFDRITSTKRVELNNSFEFPSEVPHLGKDGKPVTYTPGKANYVPAIWRSVAILSDTLARARPEVYISRLPGQPLHESPRLNRLFNKPNRDMTAFEFWRMLYNALTAQGNAYAVIEGNEFIPAHGTATRYRINSQDRYELRYTLTKLGFDTTRTYSADSVLALHGTGFDGISAPSPITAAAKQVADQLQYGSRYMTNTLKAGPRANVLLQTDNSIWDDFTPEQKAALRADILAKINDADRDQPIVLPPGYTANNTIAGITSQDLQLAELLNFSIADIARIFGVPLLMLMVFDQGARIQTPDLSSLNENFIQWSIDPIAEMVANALTDKLLTSSQRDDNIKIRINTKHLTMGTFKDTINALNIAISRSALLTPNEGRAILGYPPIAGGDDIIKPQGVSDDATLTGSDTPPEDTPEDNPQE